MARPPFPSSLDFLQLYPGNFNAGSDLANLRDDYYPVSAFTTDSTFTMPGSTTKIIGQWNVDDGDLTIAAADREPRIFCTKGKATLQFSGTSLILRAELNSSWGSASIYIDGVAPSKIAGLKTFADTINCNADSYPGVTGAQYRDFVVADGLTDAAHTLEVYINNSSTGWVVLSGAKMRRFQLKPLVRAGWHATIDTRLNDGTLTLHNMSASQIMNVTLNVPSAIRQRDGTAFGAINVGQMAPDQRYTLNFSVDGSQQPDTATLPVALQALYQDPAGNTQVLTTTDYPVTNTNLTFSSGWSKDQSGPAGVWRAFSTGAGQTATFKLDTTSFRITLQKEYGWGKADVLIGTTVYATLDCNDAVGGGFAQDVTVSGLPAGAGKTITIKSKNSSSQPFAFTKVSFDSTVLFSPVTESIPLTFNFKQIPPFAAPGARIVNGRVVWDAIDKTKQDITIPRTNSGVSEVRQYQRFPTFCVYYSPGKDDILSKYDLLVIEPSAVTRKQVAAWQAQGIKVLGYVSFGEENGVLTDIYDAQSNVLPDTDDGKGTGGYASYFNKGGNLFGEQSECGHDRQRVEGIKGCAVANANYFTGTGRCSVVCGHDSRNGYASQSKGGACGGGYTSADYWQRDGMTACSNRTCPKYTPRNKGCTQWTVADTHWGQDFAMDDSFPDQNGIWNSSFINPIAPRWFDKLRTQYMPTVMDPATEFTETHALASHLIASTSTTGYVFRTNNWPIDTGERLIVSNAAGHVYTENVDYSYDKDTGAFVLDANAGVNDAQPAPTAGANVTIIYTRKGLQCDGVFMDTVDTVDVYPSSTFQAAFASVINRLKALYPYKAFCSNRGFTILSQIIQSCSYVMFESFLVDYDWATGVYSKIADPDSVAYNDGIRQQLRDLRRSNRFDVLALNYCDNGPAGDTLRQYIADECFKEGYMSWSSTILLNDPLPNNPISANPRGAIRSNVWYLLQQVQA